MHSWLNYSMFAFKVNVKIQILKEKNIFNVYVVNIHLDCVIIYMQC